MARAMPTVYQGACALRVFSALLFLSNIHPDEYLQIPEVASHAVFSTPTVLPWEWTVDRPIRSIIPIYLTCYVPFKIVSWFSSRPPAWVLFMCIRLCFLAWSFAVDGVLPVQRRVTWSLSFVALVMCVRSFSNTLETALFALLCAQILRAKKSLLAYVATALLVVLGIWTRVTFAAFALPLLVLYIYEQWGKGVFFFAMSGFFWAALAIVTDAHYFGRPFVSSITPLNNVIYNTNTENLAHHGLHPRWLHLVVNMPLLYLPFLYRAAKQCFASRSRESITMSAVIVSGLGLLSLIPHQEPRFLLPLAIPIITLASGKTKKRWILIHALPLVLFFGVLHQGGLVPMCVRINKCPADHVVFWKTFMPSRLFLASQNVTDLGSVDSETAVNAIMHILRHTKSLLLVSPGREIENATMRSMIHSWRHLLSTWPHIDTDNLGQTWHLDALIIQGD